MEHSQLNQLTRIFNTLKLVNTKGEDTVLMAQCLTALKDFIEEISSITRAE